MSRSGISYLSMRKFGRGTGRFRILVLNEAQRRGVQTVNLSLYKLAIEIGV